MNAIPKNKVLKETKVGTKIVSIRRKYVTELNQLCSLDSNYEYDYALYLDHIYRSSEIAGWVRNRTPFYFTEPVLIPGKKRHYQRFYIPDFLVFNLDGTYEIHEVKGWMNDRSRAIIDQFKKDFPTLIYKIIEKDDILALQSEFADKLWGWAKVR